MSSDAIIAQSQNTSKKDNQASRQSKRVLANISMDIEPTREGNQSSASQDSALDLTVYKKTSDLSVVQPGTSATETGVRVNTSSSTGTGFYNTTIDNADDFCLNPTTSDNTDNFFLNPTTSDNTDNFFLNPTTSDNADESCLYPNSTDEIWPYPTTSNNTGWIWPYPTTSNNTGWIWPYPTTSNNTDESWPYPTTSDNTDDSWPYPTTSDNTDEYHDASYDQPLFTKQPKKYEVIVIHDSDSEPDPPDSTCSQIPIAKSIDGCDKDDIKIKFQSQNIRKYFEINIRLEDRLDVAMVRCAEYMEVSPEKLMFIFDGGAVTGVNTPKELNLKDGDCIDVKIID